MSRDWAAWAMTAGVIASIAGVLCLAALWRMRRVFLERQRDLENQVSTLDEAVRTLEGCLAELHPAELHPAWNGAANGEMESAADEDAAGEEGIGETVDPDIAPEIQAALAAAAVAAAGPNARLLSAREIKTRDGVSAWSQQGRVLVQGSHNVRPGRGRE